MKPIYLPLPIILFLLAATARGQEQTFEKYNCAITPPADMKLETGAAQPGVVAVFQNAGNTRAIQLIIRDYGVPDREIDERFIDGFEHGVEKNGGAKRISGKLIKIGGLTGYERIGEGNTDGVHVSMLWRAVIADQKFYLIQGTISEGDANTDTELRKSIESFRFLTPPKPPTAAMEDPSHQDISYKMGEITGAALMAIFALVAARRVFRKKQ